MYEAKTRNLNHYKGTPAKTRRVGFSLPDGAGIAALVRGVEDDWSVSVFIDEETETIFCVASSRDKSQLIVNRWLNFHNPVRNEYTTKSDQAVDLGAGKHAGNMEPLAIVQKLRAKMTKGDKPVPRPKKPLKLKKVNERKITKKADEKGVEHREVKQGEYFFVENWGTQGSFYCCLIAGGPAWMQTKAPGMAAAVRSNLNKKPSSIPGIPK